MEIEVVWDEEALDAVQKSFEYVKQFSHQSAAKLAIDLVDFGNQLNLFPDKFKLCTKSALKKKKLHCVTFRNHIFVYKVVASQVRIYKVFHAHQNPRKLIVS